MEFRELSEEEFRVFAKNHKLASFVQTPEMGRYQASHKKDVYYVGMVEQGKILCATMMFASGNFLGRKTFYAPNGYLIDYEDQALLAAFTKEMKHFVRKHGGFYLRIDPYYPLVERDINGDVVPGGYDHRSTIAYLQACGYHYLGTSSQVKYMFVLPLQDQEKEQIFRVFKPNTRNLIRKAMRPGIVVRALKRDELSIFKALTSVTGERRQFSDKPLSYYEEMYDLFVPRGELTFVIAELHTKTYIDDLEKELQEERMRFPKLSVKNESKRTEAESRIQLLERRIEEVKTLALQKVDPIVLSGGMFFLYGNEVLYLFSGNYKEYMHFAAQYRIQWEMIQYAIDHHYERYNFYGILSYQKDSPEYGVYEFKKGFHGHVVELIGEFELPTHPFYYLRKFLKKWIKKS